MSSSAVRENRPSRASGAREDVRRARNALIGSMALTFVLTRIFLHARPDTDVNVGPYNVHHLFTGVLIAVACGIPALLLRVRGPGSRLATAGFGVGVSLALDEWVYLIVTDGSNAAYLEYVSLLPGAALVLAACLYAMLVARTRAAER